MTGKIATCIPKNLSLDGTNSSKWIFGAILFLMIFFQAVITKGQDGPRLGVHVIDHQSPRGALVVAVTPGSAATRLRRADSNLDHYLIPNGYVITAINGSPVVGQGDCIAMVKQSGRELRLTVYNLTTNTSKGYTVQLDGEPKADTSSTDSHPTLPHVIKSAYGDWITEPGYLWRHQGESNEVQVYWQPGLRHPNYSNIRSADREGYWNADPGYKFLRDGDLSTRWVPGARHPDHQIFAAKREKEWRTLPGYTWASRRSGDLSVVEIQDFDAGPSYNESPGWTPPEHDLGWHFYNQGMRQHYHDQWRQTVIGR